MERIPGGRLMECKCKTERHQGNILKLVWPHLVCQLCGAKFKTRGYQALKGHPVAVDSDGKDTEAWRQS